MVRLNRAIALRKIEGPRAALRDLEEIAPELERYHLFHATRAELLSEVGRRAQAWAAQRRALDLTDNRAERSLLEQRLFR